MAEKKRGKKVKKNGKIGVFDSGIGGVTVLKEIIKILPNEDQIDCMWYGCDEEISKEQQVIENPETNDNFLSYFSLLLISSLILGKIIRKMQ